MAVKFSQAKRVQHLENPRLWNPSYGTIWSIFSNPTLSWCQSCWSWGCPYQTQHDVIQLVAYASRTLTNVEHQYPWSPCSSLGMWKIPPLPVLHWFYNLHQSQTIGNYIQPPTETTCSHQMLGNLGTISRPNTLQVLKILLICCRTYHFHINQMLNGRSQKNMWAVSLPMLYHRLGIE